MFEKGDVVQLKSGGPRMTVAGPYKEARQVNTEPTPVPGKVWCEWFEGETRQSGSFEVDTLEKISN